MVMPAPVWFPIIVDTSAPITINAQIAEQIKLLIAIGELQPNNALPTVAQLAKHLGVNPNTIAAAYNYLIESSYLIAQRGKGTFVANTQAVENLVTYKQLYDLLGQAFNTATIIGLSPSEFGTAAYAQAVMLNRPQPAALKLVFVERLQHSSEVYKAIQTEIKEHLLFLDIEDLKANQSKALEALLAADIVITTVQYLWEVTQIAESEQEVIGLDIKPDLQLLTRISFLPRNALMLLVCQEEFRSEEMKKTLQQAGVSHVKFQTLRLEYLQQNTQLLEQAEAVCVSKEVEDYVRQYSSLLPKIMVFNFNLNETNVSILKARLSAIKLTKSS